MRTLLLAATVLVTLGGTGYAQSSSNSGSNSNATVNTASGSLSTAVSNPKVNVIGNKIGNVTSSSNSGANAVSSTRSASRSAAVGNTTNVTVQGYAGVDNSGNGTGSATDPSGSGQSDQYIGYGGGYTVRNTPEVIPPSIVGGNACAVGASAASRWLASASPEAPPGRIALANAGSRPPCCSTWANKRSHSN